MSRYIIYIMCVLLYTSCSHERIHEKFSRQAKEYTKKMCPLPMDQYTMLDSLVYNPSQTTLTYHYSVSDLLDNDSIYTDAFRGIFHTKLLDNILNNVGLIELKENNVSFRYIFYSSTTQQQFMQFFYTSEEYN